MFGSDYGAVTYGNKEHLRIVKDVLPSPAERQTGILEDEQYCAPTMSI